jgi:hypothetical protein
MTRSKNGKKEKEHLLSTNTSEQITTHRPDICFLDSTRMPPTHTLHQCTQRIRLVDRHQFIAQIVATRVQRDGEINVQFVADLMMREKRDSGQKNGKGEYLGVKMYRFDRVKNIN